MNLRKNLFALTAAVTAFLAVSCCPFASCGKQQKKDSCPGSAKFATPKPAGDLYSADFSKGKWNQKDFMPVKSPRWDYMGVMDQKDNHIINHTPDLPDDVIFKKHASQVYSSLIFSKKQKMNATISSKMSFDHRMAPEILITGAIGKDKKGRLEHRDHYEVVLYDEGLNVWHHTYKNGKPGWYKAAFLRAPFKPGKVYELVIRLEKTRKGKQMTVSCDGKTLGYMDNNLPEEFYAGVVGCEGRCRFYDFKVSKK